MNMPVTNLISLFQQPQHRVEYEGLSDAAKVCEERAMDIILKATALLRSAIQDALLLSDVMRDELEDYAGYVTDSAPSEQQWRDKVQQADDAARSSRYRRGA